MTEARILGLVGLVSLICPPTPAAEPAGGNPCDILPWQTVDNGMGAEPGVVREFASAVEVPPECLRGGRVWVSRIRLGVTRTAAGAPGMDVRVSIRAPQTPGGPPGDFRTDPVLHTLANVPVFPSGGTYDVSTGPNNNQNVNNILWGDYLYISADMNGNNTANQFVAADQMGAPDLVCFTGTNGSTPADPCTTGNPSLSAVALGATGYTFYGRYSNAEINGREPLATTWAARYIGSFSGGTDLRVWRDAPGDGPEGDETICEFFNIPADFEFQCTMTAADLTALAAGGVFGELTQGASVRSTRMMPADLFIFADGFESGDTSVWSPQVPLGQGMTPSRKRSL